MATDEYQLFETALAATITELDLSFYIKEEQKTALKSFLCKKDVFAVLPTGYGKSLIYQLAPLVAKRMGLSENPLVVVVSPLIALMEDQVKEARKYGLSALQLGDHEEEQIQSGQCQIAFGSPESWLLKKKWREMLSNQVYRENLIGIVVDEVHLIYKWGKTDKGEKAFRECFSKLGELRSIVKQGTPVLALTATADLHSKAIVKNMLHLENATQVIISPNRTNIRLGLTRVSASTLDCLDWIVREVREKGPNMSPVIIYCKTLKAVGRVFCHLKTELGKHCWVDQEDMPENLLIGMFHSQTLQQNKSRVLSSLDGDGSCRVVVATTALGMGLNFPKITHVVLYGLPEDVEAILQEVGRAGRDGSQSHAIVYAIKQHTAVDEAVKSLIDKSITSCFRKALFSHFEHHTESVEPGHLCCTHCHSVCSCSSDGCDVATPAYELLKQEVSPSGKSREVTQDERVLIRDLLTTYKNSLIQEDIHLYTNRSNCTGFSDDLIDSVLEHSTEIFDVSYIIDNLPVFHRKHAQEILRIFSEVFGDFQFSEVDLPPEDFLIPDTDYTGYFDEEDEEQMEASLSSAESGLSLLRISD